MCVWSSGRVLEGLEGKLESRVLQVGGRVLIAIIVWGVAVADVDRTWVLC
jgi:hypothetical protein